METNTSNQSTETSKLPWIIGGIVVVLIIGGIVFAIVMSSGEDENNKNNDGGSEGDQIEVVDAVVSLGN